jgi:hypothetical protein
VPVNDTTFEAEVLKSPVPVLVDFWAPWCGPCRMIAPLIDELATEYEGKLKAVRGFIACVQGGATRSFHPPCAHVTPLYHPPRFHAPPQWSRLRR